MLFERFSNQEFNFEYKSLSTSINFIVVFLKISSISLIINHWVFVKISHHSSNTGFICHFSFINQIVYFIDQFSNFGIFS